MNSTFFSIITILSLTLSGCGSVETDSRADTTTNQTINNTPTDTEENTSPFSKVQNVHDGESIGIGTFKSNGLNYYNFKMPKDGNLVGDSSYTIYIYDENLNALYLNPKYPSQNIIHGSTKLKAGNYIIKFNHQSTSVPFTLNSNVLYNQNQLPLVSKGTYVNKGVQYYFLKMPKDGNLVGDSSYTIYIYDENLNALYLNPKYPSQNIIHGSTKLKAGNYIIKFNHQSTSVPFTLNSNVFD